MILVFVAIITKFRVQEWYLDPRDLKFKTTSYESLNLKDQVNKAEKSIRAAQGIVRNRPSRYFDKPWFCLLCIF